MNRRIPPISANYFGLPFIGERAFEVDNVASLKTANDTSVIFYSGDDINFLEEIQTGIVIIDTCLKDKLKTHKSQTIVFSPKPKLTFLKLLEDFFENSFEGKFQKRADFVDCKISGDAYIEPKVKLGKGCEIFPQVSLFNEVTIGEKCKILPGTVIGVSGLGDLWYRGEYHKFVHLGEVSIGSNVNIGANVSIMKGMLEDTIIGEGTRIANNVNIGHSVQIGKNCYISSGVTIGGACIIEDNSWLAVGSTLTDHVRIGKNTMVGTGAVIIKDALPNSLYLGNPARKVGERDFK